MTWALARPARPALSALLGLTLLALLSGCDGDEATPAPAPEASEGFFDEDLLFDGAIDLASETLECVGESDRMLRGFVLAPDGRLAMQRHGPARHLRHLGDVLVPKAHAAPLEGELPVPGVVVTLTRTDDIGEPTGEALVQTETNAQGAFCLAMPEDLEFGPTTMLIASHGELRLRRPVLHENDLDIYSQPEALLRLLVAEGFELSTLDVPTYLNLDVIAQTAVDLLRPVTLRPGGGLSSILHRLEETMRQDERLMATLERLRD